MILKINGEKYEGKILEEYGSDIIEEGQYVIEIFISYEDNNIQDLLNESVDIMIREKNKKLFLLEKRNVTRGIGAWEVDLRTIKDFSTPFFTFNSDNNYFSLVYVHKYKLVSDDMGNDIGGMYILKIEKTNELLNELYKSKGLGVDEGMAKIHYLVERIVGFLHTNPSKNFGNNLKDLEISEKEKELLKKIKDITGIFAHGNTSTKKEKKEYESYFDGFYDILKTFINKYI